MATTMAMASAMASAAAADAMMMVVAKKAMRMKANPVLERARFVDKGYETGDAHHHSIASCLNDDVSINASFTFNTIQATEGVRAYP